MSFEMPVGMEFDGSQSANSVTFKFADHTTSAPHFAILDRKAPVTKNGNTSMAVYRIRVFRHAKDAVTGEESKDPIEVSIRYHAYSNETNRNSDLAFLATLLASSAFRSAVSKLALPWNVASA